MTSQTKNDLKKIKDAINMLARADRKTQLTTRIGDNPAAVDAALTLIEDLCQVIREQEDMPREETINPYTGEIIRIG
jgi:hypothetical protein